MKENKNLFAEFPPVTTEMWEKLIIEDLKGEDYQRKLIWQTPEGVHVKPYYRTEDLPKSDLSVYKPIDYPFTRGKEHEQNDWEIREDIKVKDPAKANKDAIFALMKGATSLCFDITPIEDELREDTKKFSTLLNDIYFDSISLNFKTGRNPHYVLKLIENEIHIKKLEASQIDGSLNFDIFDELNLAGNFHESLNKDIDLAKSLVEASGKKLPGFRVLGVNGKLFKDCGANIAQEVAFTLAAGNEYLVLLSDRGLAVEDIASKIQFNLGTGTNYFFEIAKFRAIRYLWAKIQKTYLGSEDKIQKACLHATTSPINKTLYDPYVNILRTTTEAMAACLGGVDSISIRPFDHGFQQSSRFSERIARNIQIILKRESYFGKIADPASGAYYIESLTESIIKESWKLFQTIDRKGGYVSAFMEGYIQKETASSMSATTDSIAHGRDTLLGTNKYPKSDEKSIGRITKYEAPGKKKLKLGKPLHPGRLSEAFEWMRLRTEKHVPVPKVFLFNYGDLAKSKARAIFSTNFMGCGGFQVIDNEQFKTIQEGITAATKVKPNIIVLCSSDEKYISFAPAVSKHFKDKALMIVAGYPKDTIDELKKNGINYFIHIKSNILETLLAIQDDLGIK